MLGCFCKPAREVSQIVRGEPFLNELAWAAHGDHRAVSQQNDCRVVALNGYRFNFGDIQAAIIRQLLAASDTDNPWVHGKTLLANAGSTSMVMRDAFRHQQNWKELIAADGRGYYRLSPTCSPMQALPESHATHKEKILTR